MCECTVLSCTEVPIVGAYKRGERGREAPKSLLEVRMIEASANIGAQESVCVCVCVDEQVNGWKVISVEVPASSFYSHKEGRRTRV